MVKRSTPHVLLLVLSFLLLLVGIPYIIAVNFGIEKLGTKIGIGVYVFLIIYVFFLTLSGSAVVELFAHGHPKIAWAFLKGKALLRSGDEFQKGLNKDLTPKDVVEMGAIFRKQQHELEYLPGLQEIRKKAPTLGTIKRAVLKAKGETKGGEEELEKAARPLTGLTRA